MNIDLINITIAEACGWTEIREGTSCLIGTAPDGRDSWAIPDYCHDLNACLEMEIVGEVYSYPRRERYFGNIQNIVNQEGVCRPFLSATAIQRCEAFLRTIGKWVE